jgi:exodeoxyribonuclease V alpha subunit
MIMIEVESFAQALQERGDIGALEVFQAKFLALRGHVLCAIPAEALQGILLLLLANQRRGNTVATLEELKSYEGALPFLPTLQQIQEGSHGFAAQAGTPQAQTALILWDTLQGETLWGFQRAWKAEERIGKSLERFCPVGEKLSPAQQAAPASLFVQALQEGVRNGFPLGGSPYPRQIEAIEMALRQSFCIVCGGPGTGKTTVVKMMVAAVCFAYKLPADRVVVCAPTGRAKARLEESIHKDLPAGSPLQSVAGKTLHSLLRYRSNGDPVFHAGNPLPYDLVIVDEVSMVDSAMFADLTDALSPQARLVLVGDMNQLPSVESGAVLGDLTTARRGQLQGQLCELNENRRTKDPQISNWFQGLPVALESGWSPVVTDKVLEGHLQQWIVTLKKSWAMLRPKPKGSAEGIPINAFKELIENGRILCCTNGGEQGREGYNRRCVQLFAPGHKIPKEYLDGEPLIVEQNQQVGEVSLYNGDLGVAWVEGTRQRGLFYSGGRIQVVDLSRVQGLNRAYAITVHKSQGSEFSKVILVLPADDARMVSQQLLYTAVTRAKIELVVLDPANLLSNPLRKETRSTWLGRVG